MKYVLGIDFGGGASKATLLSEAGEIVATNTVEYPTLYPSPRFVEQDPMDWYRATKTNIAAVLEKSGVAPTDVKVVALDAATHTAVLMDKDFNILRPAIYWTDTRCIDEVNYLKANYGDIIKEQTLHVVDTIWTLPQLLWVKDHEPEIWAKTKKVFLLEDWILYKLTGRFISEKTLQSSTIYFDIHKAEWWGEMLDFIGVSPDMLPKLYSSAERVGEYEGMQVVTGAIDQIAGAIGAGVVKPGIVSVMTGTTMVIFLPSDSVPEYNAASIVPCHYNYDDKYCLLSWTPTAGMALKWFRNALCENFSFRELDELASAVPAGSDGVTFLPYLCGSTMPKYNPAARGSFTGLTTEHTRGHFVRAVMESVACMLKSNLDYLGLEVDEIRAMGGGASSPLWCQMKADMTGKKLVTLKNKETACLGSAILAAVGVGRFSSVEEAAKAIELDRVYESQGVDYTECYERYTSYDKLLNN